MPLKYVEPLPESLRGDKSQCETRKRDYSTWKNAWKIIMRQAILCMWGSEDKRSVEDPFASEILQDLAFDFFTALSRDGSMEMCLEV